MVNKGTLPGNQLVIMQPTVHDVVRRLLASSPPDAARLRYGALQILDASLAVPEAVQLRVFSADTSVADTRLH